MGVCLSLLSFFVAKMEGFEPPDDVTRQLISRGLAQNVAGACCEALRLRRSKFHSHFKFHDPSHATSHAALRLLRHLAQLLQTKLENERRENYAFRDRKRKRKIEDKKQAHGLRQ